MHRALAPLLSIIAVLSAGQAAPPLRSTFASEIAQLSESGGYFDTDNLISNERSYLQVLPALRRAGISGGAYIGVGPDQNFSYIARVRPAIAFIVDIRRDNLLLHLLFKALFAESPTRIEYLAALFGRAPPADPARWKAAAIDRILAYVESSAPLGSTALPAVDRRVRSFGVALSAADLQTIRRFHQAFIDAGPSLKFESHGRGPRSYYPTYRDLLLETDPDGHPGNYLAAEDDYVFVRSLQRRDLIIPVVGNLSGPSALAAIGRMIQDRGEPLTTFYTSNVEFYLFGDGSFQKFVDNLRRIPHVPNALVIRSVFDGYAFRTAPGYYSASMVQPIDDLLARARAGVGYRDLVQAGR